MHAVGAETLFRPQFVLSLFLRQIVQQLSDACVLRARSRLLIKNPRLHFKSRSLTARRFRAQRLREPDGASRYQPFHVAAPDQRYVLAELGPVKINQPAPMRGFLIPHAFKH